MTAGPEAPGDRNAEVLLAAGREVAISNPDKLLFPKPRHTKLDLVRYYLAVSEGALRGAGGLPRGFGCAHRRGGAAMGENRRIGRG